MPELEWEEIEGAEVGWPPERHESTPRTMFSDWVMSSVWRAKIPGGWLMRSIEESLTFIPDPEHKWDGNSLP